jgi:dCMP deaminase
MKAGDKWNNRFLEMALKVGEWSKDRSTKVGAVIVKDRQILSTGYNGFPRGIDDSIDERHERPLKYAYTEHAERNAIYNASYNGVNIKGGTIFSTFFPCVDCCRAIIQTGIVQVITVEPKDVSEKWAESFKLSKDMLDEAGIKIVYY